MDDIKEFLTSLFKSARDRVANPFVGAFLLAWAVWNFRIILVLVGDGGDDDGGWQAKIEYLDKHYLNNGIDSHINLYILPALAALFWVFVLPGILRFITVYHERQLNITKSAVLAELEKSPLDADAVEKLTAAFLADRKKWKAERDELLSMMEPVVSISSIKAANGATPIPPAEGPTPEKAPAELVFEPIPLEEQLSTAGPVEAAKLLNLRAFADGTLHTATKRPPILFRGLRIRWPWLINKANIEVFPEHLRAKLDRQMLREDGLSLLYIIDSFDGFSVNEIEMRTGLHEVAINSALEDFVEVGLLEQNGDHYSPNADTTAFMKCLVKLGFDFTSED